MSDLDLTPILNDLAAGRIDAAEASRRIDALKARAASAERASTGSDADTPRHSDDEAGRRQYSPFARESFRTQTTPADVEAEPVEAEPVVAEPVAEAEAPRPRTKGLDRVIIRSTGRRVRLVGDASVATLSVEGPHVLRRTGNVLEVTSDGDLGPSIDGFSFIRPPRSLDDLRQVTVALGKELYVRVNPSIPVDVEVTAGTLSSHKVPTLGKVRVTAGSAGLHDVEEASDVLVQAGSATVEGPLQRGRSRVRVESGQLTVTLTEGANVTVRAEAQLGRIAWPADVQGSVDEYVIGNGSGRLDVGIVMGFAAIKVAGTDEEKDK
ncbi:MAG TPA: hypothetical protein PKN27_11110 [Propionibacteriaceae bacterium]|nr:hypothetical protein [Propionibacteriaceae bacterium]